MDSWDEIVAQALQIEQTPMYVMSWPHVEEALQELMQAGAVAGGPPVRHWLSFKSQPLPELVRSWRAAGHGVEVVSEFELLAAQAEGFDVDHIVVNGVAKHAWLKPRSQAGLRVHFDSLEEVKALCRVALADRWRIGLRVHVSQEHDPDDPNFGAQFGLNTEECGVAYDLLRSAGLDIEGLHFHLRSNVESPSIYGEAIQEMCSLCSTLKIRPPYLDCGGGVPVVGERTLQGDERQFDLADFFAVLERECHALSSLQEIWLENGRFLTSRAGVLVLTVLDKKERAEGQYLLCDGGRTNHALVSDWGKHFLTVRPRRPGLMAVMTTVCGPTCMAYDWLYRDSMSTNIQIGDKIVWHNAGAYHVPWETRFSHGLAPIVWFDGGHGVRIVRKREHFEEWWRALGAEASA